MVCDWRGALYGEVMLMSKPWIGPAAVAKLYIVDLFTNLPCSTGTLLTWGFYYRTVRVRAQLDIAN